MIILARHKTVSLQLQSQSMQHERRNQYRLKQTSSLHDTTVCGQMIGEQAHVQWDQTQKENLAAKKNIQQRSHEDADKNNSKETSMQYALSPSFRR